MQPALREKTIYHKDLLPVTYVVADMAGKTDSPLYGMFGARGRVGDLAVPNGGTLTEHFITQPSDPYRGYALKWDGEWQVTYETFRDMGIAYGVGLVLIYLLVVAQFGSYVTPLVIMAPIPLTIIGVMPGHALLGAPFTATSMIGMIALAGIIVRNSILLVDFVNLQLAKGVPFAQAIVDAAAARAKPIALTGLAAMLGAFFILDDPIFNGLAIALVFGILVSTLLTLVVIPVLYYAVNRRAIPVATGVAVGSLLRRALPQQVVAELLAFRAHRRERVELGLEHRVGVRLLVLLERAPVGDDRDVRVRRARLGERALVGDEAGELEHLPGDEAALVAAVGVLDDVAHLAQRELDVVHRRRRA